MENFMWDEWTRYHSTGPGPGDDVSTSNVALMGLPDPTASTISSASSGRLFNCSFPAQANTGSSWMATFHPQSGLAPEHQASLDPELVMHDEAADSLYLEPTTGSEYYYRTLVNSSIHPPTTGHEAPSPLFSGIYDDHGAKLASAAGDVAAVLSSSAHVLGPQSPSSPLAVQNGMLNPLGDPWEQQHQHHHGWSSSRITTGSGHSRNICIASPLAEEDPDPGRRRHTDIYIGPNGTIESTPGGWTPQFHDGMAKPTTGGLHTIMMMMASTTAGDQSESGSSAQLHRLGNRPSEVHGSFLTDRCRPDPDQNVRAGDHVWFGKDRLELYVDCDDHNSTLQLKLSKYSVGHHAAAGPSKREDHPVQEMLRTSRYYNCPASRSLPGSQATHIIAIGPALNTNGKPRARRGSATDPQSVYARQRRERINGRLTTLQHLVPNGAKVDIVTMLDEAYDYVKFLQYQVTLLQSDEFWMHATPYNYNGMDISNMPASGQTQELESSAATLD